MSDGVSRRSFLGVVGLVTGALTFGPRVVGASTSEDRYIVDMSTTSADAMGDVTMVHDLRSEIGYVVVEGGEAGIPDDARYMTDMEIELEEPVEERDSGLNADDDVDDTLYDLQWDKQEQKIGDVHEVATGEGARIGVLDDGVLGANPDTAFSHPDLPNVRADLSYDFTNDGNGPGPLNDDHGTHVAGTAAAAGNDLGVVGVAPDAEVVDLRVFSGRGASTGDIIAALIVGAGSEDDTFTVTIGNTDAGPEESVTVSGSDCDVLNCSFGIPPSIPASETDQSPFAFIGPYLVLPGSIIDLLIDLYTAAGRFARQNGALPVASAGNSGVNMSAPVSSDRQPERFRFEGIDVDPTNLPAEAPGFLTVGAAGPIGFGWPLGPNPEEVVPGLSVEQPFQTELPSEEPAFYTNYGAGALDVTAGGGNADIDAIDAGVRGFYDLVLNTGIANLDPNKPEDTRLDTYLPGYTFKAGTSFSAPNVSGLAALLFGADSDLRPGDVADVIRETAEQRPIGRSGETTAPASVPNVGFDGTFDGDTASNPGSAPNPFDSQTYRGAGHIDVAAAVEQVTGTEIGEDSEEDADRDRGNQ